MFVVAVAHKEAESCQQSIIGLSLVAAAHLYGMVKMRMCPEVECLVWVVSAFCVSFMLNDACVYFCVCLCLFDLRLENSL